MKPFFYALALLALAPAARAELPLPSGILYLYSSRDCSGSPVNVIPTGTSNVSCEGIANLGNDTIYGIRVAGDNVCVRAGGYKNTAEVCKAYNGK
jgi:hypothetical protein